MNTKTKGLILTLLIIGAFALTFATTRGTVSAYAARSKKPVWELLDYTGDGIFDCQYHVTEHHIKAKEFITVVYKDLDCIYLGEEVWVENQGIIKDTFEPWTYPFPS